MTWRTPLGKRPLVGPVAELVRAAIGWMHDLIVEELADRDELWSF